MSRILSEEYESARRTVADALSARLAEVDKVHDVVESIYHGKVRYIESADRNRGSVSVLLLLLTKSLKTFRAIRATCLEGCGQDAAVLLRVMFETCTAVKWLVQEQTGLRAKMLAAHSDLREVIMRREQSSTPGLEAIGRAHLKQLEPLIEEWTIELGGATMKDLKRHWSGLEGGLCETATRLPGWLTAYNSLYRGTSRPAHGADLGDHGTFSADKPFPVFKLLPGTDDCDRVLAGAGVLMHEIASELDQWLELGKAAELDALSLRRIRVVNDVRKGDDNG